MEYLIHIFNLSIIYIALTVSLNLIIGYGGMVSMAHAAFFCVGGYLSALFTLRFVDNVFLGVVIAVVITGTLGGLLAAPFIKVQEEYLVLFTLAFQMVIFHLMLSMYDITGGDSGIFGISEPRIFGISLDTPAKFVPLMVVFIALVYLACLTVTRSPFGRVLKGIREDETAVTSLGKNVIRFKILIFMVGTGIAAASGAVYAHYSRFINPSIGNLDESILIIAMVVLGGTANLWGSALGAFLLIMIPEVLNFIPGATDLIVPLRGFIYGALLILFMRFRPEGLIPEYFHLQKEAATDAPQGEPAPARRRAGAETKAGEAAPGGVVLEVRDISKRFGGIRAVDGFSLSLENGKITALVGPNGCGKTTAFNIITGFLKPDKGAIIFSGKDITEVGAYRMPHIGIVRSWQDVRAFQGMTVLDNILFARQNQKGERLLNLFLRPWKVREERDFHLAQAFKYLDMVGLASKAREIVRNLSYAEQKLVTIARLLAAEPRVILLDEPSSGIDPTWVQSIMKIIKKLADSGKTICIVEHNLDVVREISDTVYFMAEGKKVAQGGAEQLMADPALAEIYFGV